MLRLRQTCFSGDPRAETIASSRALSEAATSFLISVGIPKAGRPTAGGSPQQDVSVTLKSREVPKAGACVDPAEMEQTALSKVGDGLPGQRIVADVRQSAENESAIPDPTGQDIDPETVDDRVFVAGIADGAVACQTGKNVTRRPQRRDTQRQVLAVGPSVEPTASPRMTVS
jgi:hypothetical protein